jgi:pimeloyl-ACP methyl ester carboxylesterase
MVLDIYRSLMLVSTFHYFPKKLKRLLFNNRKEKFEAVYRAGNQTEFLAHMALYSWNKNLMGTFSHYFRPKHFIFLESLKRCLEVNNRSLLPKIKVPTLIIGGQYDAVLPVWIQASIHKLIPHSEFIYYEEYWSPCQT